MKKISLFIAILMLSSCQNQAQNNIKAMETQKPAQTQTIYQFKVTDLYGKEFDFSTLKGKKLLIVNTASECGLTPQYKDLEAIYSKYKDKNFLIIEGKNTIKEEDLNETNYLHRGISARDFRREFKLADHVEIENAHLELGILNVHLKREIPEEQKPRSIAITYNK